MSRRRPFHRVEHGSSDAHPVAVAVARRVRHLRKMERAVSSAARQVASALGDKAQLWLKLEALLARVAAEYQEAYFDIGFQHGAAAARADEWRRGRALALTRRARKLVTRLRDETLQADLVPAERLAVLLEVTWAVIGAMPNRSEVPPPD